MDSKLRLITIIFAFISIDGKVFIETPFGQTYTIYDSADQYNQRNKLPVFIQKEQVNISLMQTKSIDLDSLTINI
jgi:hypothetical protein